MVAVIFHTVTVVFFIILLGCLAPCGLWVRFGFCHFCFSLLSDLSSHEQIPPFSASCFGCFLAHHSLAFQPHGLLFIRVGLDLRRAGLSGALGKTLAEDDETEV